MIENEKEIEENINTENQITAEFQKDSRYGINRFIVDLCQSLKLNDEICSLAMLITNYFFVKNCYLYYDKLYVACGAVYLAAKSKSSQFNIIDELCSALSKLKNKLMKDDNIPKLKSEISQYEKKILKTLNYNIPESNPTDYIYFYCPLLYPNNEQEIMVLAQKICNDSYFTYANNLFNEYTVGLTCVLMAAKLLGLPLFLEEDFQSINNMRAIYKENMSEKEFNDAIMSYDASQHKINKGKKGDFFDNLSIYKKLHPYLNEEKLNKCIRTITDFYIDMKRRTEKEK